MKRNKEYYKALYEYLLIKLKAKNIKIIHKKMDGSMGGYYDIRSKIIYVDKECKYTKNGCFYLCHEYGHWKQHKAKKFKKFFNFTGYEPFSEELLDFIMEAENDADKIALSMLKDHGFEKVLNSQKDLRDYYSKYYFH